MIVNIVRSVLDRIRDGFAGACHDDRGIGVVEVILILVVLIGLVVIFKDQMTSLVETIFGRIAEDAGGI